MTGSAIAHLSEHRRAFIHRYYLQSVYGRHMLTWALGPWSPSLNIGAKTSAFMELSI